MPYIVLVVDELADLMMLLWRGSSILSVVCSNVPATAFICIVATQRPSVDVVTGLIKANFPTRISFTLTSQVDSRTILDTVGAEKLLGEAICSTCLLMPVSQNASRSFTYGCWDRQAYQFLGWTKKRDMTPVVFGSGNSNSHQHQLTLMMLAGSSQETGWWTWKYLCLVSRNDGFASATESRPTSTINSKKKVSRKQLSPVPGIYWSSCKPDNG